MPDDLLARMSQYVGRTVTIFTTSGGLSGSGFTGVLAAICGCTVKLITDVGAAPACAVGSSCGYGGGYGNGYGGYNRNGCCGGTNWLGSVVEIPIDRIAGFVHNAI